MFTQKSINIFHSVQEIMPFSLFQNLELGKASTDDKCHFAIVSLFSEFKPRQKLNQSQMSFDNLMGYILTIPMSIQYFVTIFHSVQEIAPLSLFAEFGVNKASTNEKCHFAISSARSRQYQCLSNNLSKYSTQFKRLGHFHFFRIWSSAKPRPMRNVILPSLGLHLVNMNIYAKVYQNIPLSSRDRAIYTFFQSLTSATPRPIPNDILQSLGLHLVNITAYAKFYQNVSNCLRVIDIFHEQASVKIFTNRPVTESNVWL